MLQRCDFFAKEGTGFTFFFELQPGIGAHEGSLPFHKASLPDILSGSAESQTAPARYTLYLHKSIMYFSDTLANSLQESFARQQISVNSAFEDIVTIS